MELENFNALKNEDAREAFRRCCGSERWVDAMVASLPTDSLSTLMRESEAAFAKLERSDWMDAFAAHPKIGDVNSLKAKYGATKTWASNEQSGAVGISDELAQELAHANEEYLKKFGYIFIVCATGKSAKEMLDMCLARLPNDAETELPIAANEQRKITQLRLEKL